MQESSSSLRHGVQVLRIAPLLIIWQGFSEEQGPRGAQWHHEPPGHTRTQACHTRPERLLLFYLFFIALENIGWFFFPTQINIPCHRPKQKLFLKELWQCWSPAGGGWVSQAEPWWLRSCTLALQMLFLSTPKMGTDIFYPFRAPKDELFCLSKHQQASKTPEGDLPVPPVQLPWLNCFKTGFSQTGSVWKELTSRALNKKQHPSI